MILCFVEYGTGGIEPASLGALVLGRRLSGTFGSSLEVVAVGTPDHGAVATLRRHGVTVAHTIEDDRLAEYLPEAWAYAVSAVVDSVAPAAVIAAGSEQGNEVMAHLAAIQDLALAVNCQAVESEEPFLVTRQRWGGSLLEEAVLDGGIKLLTVAADAFQAREAPADECVVRHVRPALPERVFRVRRFPTAEAEAPGVSLGEARVVVGGGRGVGNAEGFRVLEELAELLGGAVGCSRAVTSSGWRPHAEQIGQTGERITADLYIACGISGAMQHIVGAKGAKHILAINTDPDATIMSYADYAIIGDLHEVVPAIIAEVKKVKPVL